MKTKKEAETLNKKLPELSEDDLAQVSGGFDPFAPPPGYDPPDNPGFDPPGIPGFDPPDIPGFDPPGIVPQNLIYIHDPDLSRP